MLGPREELLGQEKSCCVKRRVTGSREEWQSEEKSGWVKRSVSNPHGRVVKVANL